MTMKELAERVESATGPDRELDALIEWPELFEPLRVSMDVDGRMSVSWNEDKFCRSGHVRAYTASLDAAMTLVPEGWRMAALCEREPWFCRLETCDFKSVTWGKGEDWITDIVAGHETASNAATPALALCAAALRVIASQETTR